MLAKLAAPSFQHISLSANLVIFAIAGAVVMYGLMFGHAKVRNLALSTYVGIVLANQLGKGLHDYLIKNHHSIDLGILRLILFAAPIILLEFSRRNHKGGHHGFVISIILSILTGGLIIGMGLNQLETNAIKHITDGSIIAFEIYTYRLWLVAIVPLLIIIEAFIGPGKDDKKKH